MATRKTKPDRSPLETLSPTDRKLMAKKSRAMCRWPKISYQRAYDKPSEMEMGVEDYFETCAQLFRPYTWSGLATHLGITCGALYQYYLGERGNTEGDCRGFVDLLSMARQVIEASKEEMGLLGLYHPTFTKFDLKNQHGWKEHTSVDINSSNIPESVDATDPVEASKQYQDIMNAGDDED